MNTDRLQEFTVVVDEGSLTKAAARLHCTQSALSKHVAALERELGCSLLERGAEGVRPTAAGTVLYGQAARILKAVQTIYNSVGYANAAANAHAALHGSENHAKDAPRAPRDLSSPAMGHRASMLQGDSGAAFSRRYSLDPRELTCLNYYLDGQSLDEIAGRLMLTRDEAAQVLAGVYRKMKARGKERLERMVQLP